MRRYYTRIGRLGNYEKDEIDRSIKETETEWEPFRKENLPYCQGEAIKSVVEGCNIPLNRITRMFLHGAIKGGHGFYGLDVEYNNARVQIYIADNGVSCCPVAMDVWEKEEAQK